MLTLTFIISDVKVDALSYLRYSMVPDSSLSNSFNIDRMYINFKGNILKNDVLKVDFRFTTDVGQIKDIAKSGSYKSDTIVKIPNSSIVGSYYLYSKYAFFEISYKNYKFYFGQTYNFWIRLMDNIWGYRFIEKSSNDYFSVISSADLGAVFEYNSKIINSSIGIYNGEGYNKIEDNKFKDIAGLLSVYLLNQEDLKIGIHGYGYYGKYKNENEKIRGIGAISFNYELVNVGFEYSYFKGSTLTSGDTISSNLISGFITLKPINLFDVFFRFDRYKNERDFFIGGFVFNFNKQFRASINYKQDEDNKTINFQTEIKF